MEYVADQKVHVEFRMDSVHSQFQSDAAGHPVFVEKPFIMITTPGSQNSVIDTIADEHYQRRFPEQWARFKNGQSEGAVNGWRLESWPAVNTAQVKTLKYSSVFTVEQLAGLSDTACQNLGMGTMELRTKAKAALLAAAGGADAERAATESARRDSEMQDMRELLRQQSEQIAALTAPKRGPGRPAKAEEAEST
jgi:hypothetical protein